MNFIIYDNITGRILRTVESSGMRNAVIQIHSGNEEIFMGEADQETQYVIDDAIIPRPDLGLSDVTVAPGGDPVEIVSGLPEGTTARAGGQEVPIVDGALRIVPENVVLVISPPFPLRRAVVRVTVEP